MAHTAKTYAEALQLAISESKPDMADTVIANLIDLLKSENNLSLYANIIEEYEILSQKEAAKHNVEAVFAKDLKTNGKILDELNTILGENVDMKSKIDNDLVGGMVLRVDDTLIDASIKGQLGRMRENLSE